MKYLEFIREKKQDEYYISDWLKSSCRPYEELAFISEGDIGELVNTILSKFKITEKNARIEVEKFLDYPPQNFDEWFYEATLQSDYSAMEEFLDKGADINYQDKYGDTALIALTKNHYEKNRIKHLLSLKPDIFIKNNGGKDFYDVANPVVKRWIEEIYPDFVVAKKYNL